MPSKDDLVDLLLYNKEQFKAEKEKISDFIDMSEISLSATDISDVSLAAIDFSGSSFSETQFTNVSFAGCDLTSCDFTRCRFIECDFSSATLYGADFSYSEIHYCTFQDADMAGCILNESNLEESDLALSSNLSSCRFDEGTIWPDSDKLPEDFDSKYSYDLSSLQDEEETGESDYMY